jgi:hypothetical protein
MGRIRTIKPEFPQSESMGRVSRESRLLFLLLFTVADDSGRLRGNSRMLASLLFPYDEDAGRLIDGWMGELEREGCIRRYKHNGDNYLEVNNWLKHQKIDKPTPSKLPAFDESSRVFEESSRILPVGMDQGRDMDQGSGGEEERITLTAPSAQSEPDGTDDSEREIIERLFLFYCESVGRNPRQYTLTPERRKKALARLRERRKLHGTLDAAEADLAKAIENLAASEYHATGGYIDWLEQIFRSTEEFEKRLTWKQPVKGTTYAPACNQGITDAEIQQALGR